MMAGGNLVWIVKVVLDVAGEGEFLVRAATGPAAAKKVRDNCKHTVSVTSVELSGLLSFEDE